MLNTPAPVDWATLWAPYDEATYRAALADIPRGATVLDIGAGDLRFARRVAAWARFVYAVERRPELAAAALAAQPPDDLPPNIAVICADARLIDVPDGVDTAVLLMRHSPDFDLYARKLAAAGCRRLITNARWGMSVECVDLARPAMPYEALAAGWFACRCGATGFREGPPEWLTGRLFEDIAEVSACPACEAGQSV
jgi:hypothetical protein